MAFAQVIGPGQQDIGLKVVWCAVDHTLQDRRRLIEIFQVVVALSQIEQCVQIVRFKVDVLLVMFRREGNLAVVAIGISQVVMDVRGVRCDVQGFAEVPDRGIDPARLAQRATEQVMRLGRAGGQVRQFFQVVRRRIRLVLPKLRQGQEMQDIGIVRQSQRQRRQPRLGAREITRLIHLGGGLELLFCVHVPVCKQWVGRGDYDEKGRSARVNRLSSRQPPGLSTSGVRSGSMRNAAARSCSAAPVSVRAACTLARPR